MSTPALLITNGPNPPPGSPPSIIAKDWAWLTSHIIAILLVLGLAAGAVYFIESLEANHDEKVAALYTSISTAQAAQNQALETQLKTDETNWATVQAQLLAQNSQLAQDIAQKNQQLTVQVKADATLDAQSAATKLAQQTGAAPNEVTAQQDSIDIDLPTARRIVSDLDTLPVVESNLASTQTQLTNETTIANNNAQDAADEKKLVAGKDQIIADNQKAFKQQLDEANAKTKKAGIKGFFAGAAAVLIGLLGHSIPSL